MKARSHGVLLASLSVPRVSIIADLLRERRKARYLVFQPCRIARETPRGRRLLLVLDAGEYHLGARNLRLRVLDVLLELSLVPGDAGILVGIGVGITLRRAGVAAVEAIEFRADLVLGAFADRVTGHAFIERSLAGRDVLRERYGGRE